INSVTLHICCVVVERSEFRGSDQSFLVKIGGLRLIDSGSAEVMGVDRLGCEEEVVAGDGVGPVVSGGVVGVDGVVG
ncbi:hypothetical protein Tco_1288544, partial [Tanacetum coccineum]